MTAGPSPTRRWVEGFRRDLLDAAPELWRDLPWRATRDPWHVLVSEVMLQQTQAARVVDPYLRFVARFPTAGACAAAGAAEVVRAWAGLGYNRRAVALHRSAVLVTEQHGGDVPADFDGLRSLPGVGPYTARAVLAFAFSRSVAVVDTNVARLVARAVAGRSLRLGDAQALADVLVPPNLSWQFNQALFDLGARHCTARRPRCGDCPVRGRCRWAQTGYEEPDPAAGVTRGQGPFAGSDRQGRGRLVDAMRRAPVPGDGLAGAAGWPGDPGRARRVADALVRDGVAAWRDGSLVLA